MRSLPVVGGVLVLGFGLLVFLSSFRETREHVYRERHGESAFAIDVPRSWTATDAAVGSSVEVVGGPLPSGRRAAFSLHSHRYASPAAKHPDAPLVRTERPDEVLEHWSRAGWRQTLGVRFHAPPGGAPRQVRTVYGRIERGDLTFSVNAFGYDDLSEDDRAILERCARSIRWIGK